MTGLLAWRMGASRWGASAGNDGDSAGAHGDGYRCDLFDESTFEPVFWMTVALATIELAAWLAGRGIRCSGRTVASWWVLLPGARRLAWAASKTSGTRFFFLTCLLAALLMTMPEKVTGFEMVPDRPCAPGHC